MAKGVNETSIGQPNRQARLITVYLAIPLLTIPFPGILQIVVGRVKATVQDEALADRVIAQGRRAALRWGIRRVELAPAAAAQDPGIVAQG